MKALKCQGGGQGRLSQHRVKPSAVKEFNAKCRRSDTQTKHLQTHSTKMHTKCRTKTRKAQTHPLLFSWIWLLAQHPLAKYPEANCRAEWSSGCCSLGYSESPAARALCSSASSSLLWDACSYWHPLLKQHKPAFRDEASCCLFLGMHMKWDLFCSSTPASATH